MVQPVAPEFSIIVPVYNVAPYLTPCLESLVTQDCRDVEIILVDDCSSDESGAIADKFAAEYGFVKVIHAAKNQGVAAARNLGLAKAGGKYVIFVDGDDRLLENAVSGVRRHLESVGDVDIMVCRFVSECGVLNNGALFQHEIVKTRRPEKFLAFVVEHGHHVDHCWNYIARRSFINDHGARFVDAIIGEDSEFIISLLSKATSICLYPGDFYWYRIRPASLKNTKGVAQTTCFVTNSLEMFRLVDVRTRFVLHQVRHAIGIFLARLCLADDEEVSQIAGELGDVDLTAIGFLLPEFGLAARERDDDEILKILRQIKTNLTSAILALLPAGAKPRLFVYCAGPIGEAVLTTLQKSGRAVEAVIDDNEMYSGLPVWGVIVKPSSILQQMSSEELRDSFVIVCTQKASTFEKISKSLVQKGLKPEQTAHWMF